MRHSTDTLINHAFGAQEGTFLRQAALAVAGTALITLAAKVQVPFYPVPMTLQALAVLVIGAAFGWRLGAATLIAYLAEGAMGLPVFAGAKAGLGYMMGPTGGYLLGFVLAAALTGYLAEKGLTRSVPGALATMTLGMLAIYIPGYLWLASLIGPQKAWLGGVAPFLYGDLLKIALGAALLPAAWWVVKRFRGA